jgi:folate-binding protein YgfZ
LDDIEGQVDALLQGRATVDLSSWLKIRVEGSDASAWLQDLLSADMASLRPGQARRSLLLGPTGRVRADMHVARTRTGFLLLQDHEQSRPVGSLLSPYLLSADVALRDASADLALIALVGAAAARVALSGFAPSALGPGLDVVAPIGEAARRIEDELRETGLVEVGPRALETWRIRRGIARMGPDFDAESLPSEAGLDEAIDRTKGCFLGQESIARIDNLGHPPRLLVHVSAGGAVERGDAVLDGTRVVGTITSAAPTTGADRASVALARVTWVASEHRLTLADGRPLTRVSAEG